MVNTIYSIYHHCCMGLNCDIGNISFDTIKIKYPTDLYEKTQKHCFVSWFAYVYLCVCASLKCSRVLTGFALIL